MGVFFTDYTMVFITIFHHLLGEKILGSLFSVRIMAKEIQGMIDFLQQSGRFFGGQVAKQVLLVGSANSAWNLSLGQQQPDNSAGARFGMLKWPLQRFVNVTSN